MSLASVLKSYLETGDLPTGTQFAEIIDNISSGVTLTPGGALSTALSHVHGQYKTTSGTTEIASVTNLAVGQTSVIQSSVGHGVTLASGLLRNAIGIQDTSKAQSIFIDAVPGGYDIYYSAITGGASLPQPDGSPSNLSLTGNADSIDATWTRGSTNNDAVIIEWKTASAGTYQSQTLGASVVAHNIPGLAADTYDVRVREMLGTQSSAYVGPLQTTVGAFSMPTFLSNLGEYWDLSQSPVGAFPAPLVGLNQNRGTNLQLVQHATDVMPPIIDDAGTNKGDFNSTPAVVAINDDMQTIITGATTMTYAITKIKGTFVSQNREFFGKLSGANGLTIGLTVGDVIRVNLKALGVNYLFDGSTVLVSGTEYDIIVELDNANTQISVWINGTLETAGANDGDFNGTVLGNYLSEGDNPIFGARNLAGTADSNADFDARSLIFDTKAWSAQDRVDVMANS